MKYKTYTLSSRLSPEEAIARVGKLLAAERVQYRVEGLSIFTTRTPMPLGLQRAHYSKRNWVGLNPFAYVSGVSVECQAVNGGPTQILVRVDRFRTFTYSAIWVCASGLVSVRMPTLAYAVSFIAVSFALAWLCSVVLLGGYLLKKEIADCLNA
jgi:hypothetical protein